MILWLWRGLTTPSALHPMKAEDIVEFIKPEKILTVPALGNDELGDFDRLSQKFSYITEAFLDKLTHTSL